ncbi:hypothetical protein FC87_GL000005 [Fructilactobacillus florum DSM 22689 = JCM 16035]|uniref:IrrE N-terminal-like domain-containing protein n=1 Tax=Fructilactobacillus florum DSM 22689 = JCM 16035 TaxID=1423745 RepID=A0A0R2CWH9_9LACO|nr:hypothetical protein FC87_GL000005 [Fructilactobacillus florum DSM 22689 = JCM 16035]
MSNPHDPEFPEDENTWGYTDLNRANIFINSELDKNHQKQTLIHELIHIMLWESGKTSLYNDENLVTSLANSIFELIQGNSLFVN